MNRELVDLICNMSTNFVEPSEVNEDTDLIDDLGFDSIGLVELSVELESKFGVCIDDDELDIDNLRKISFLNSKVEA